MWLDFKVFDDAGTQLYRLGAVVDGHTEPGTQSFRVVLGDKNNNVVDVNILDADRILYDTRIEPRGFRDVEYEVELPAALQGDVRIVADLNYWSFSPALLHHLLGDDAPPAHITLMARAQIKASVELVERNTRINAAISDGVVKGMAKVLKIVTGLAQHAGLYMRNGRKAALHGIHLLEVTA